MAAQLRDGVDIAEHLCVQRGAIRLPVTSEEFAFEARHVHAYGAFGFAGAAFETEVERFIDAVVIKVRLTECAGAAAGDILLVPRDHVGRAHGAFEGLAAGSQTAAHFNCTAEPAVFGVIEKRARVG